jgi:excisionase family DNA binding protein
MNTAPPVSPVFLTLAETAALVRVQRQTLIAWVREGRFPAPARVGRKYLFNLTTVERFLAEQRGIR